MSPYSLLLLFSLLPLISSWTYPAGYRECSSGCCHYTSSNISLDYNCTSTFCQSASNSSCTYVINSYYSGYRECSNAVNCCYYSSLLTYLDYDCQGYYCTNATNSSYCNDTYTSGYRSCIYGCCKYQASLATLDYNCVTIATVPIVLRTAPPTAPTAPPTPPPSIIVALEVALMVAAITLNLDIPKITHALQPTAQAPHIALAQVEVQVEAPVEAQAASPAATGLPGRQIF